jgi:branched-subunit amino acid transport protein
MSTLESIIAILGLAGVTVLTRNVFLWPERKLQLPAWVGRALQYAPLAALVAIVVPDVFLTQDHHLLSTLADARLAGAAAATLYFFWRRGILGTIVVGMLVFLPLRIGLGW